MDRVKIGAITVGQAPRTDVTADILPLLGDCQLLERGGCTLLAVPCNTSHFFAGRLQGELSIPLVHMPRETVGGGVEPVEVAARDEVETGPATILSNIRGDEVEEFHINITHLYPEGDGTRSMMIEVDDPALLEATGGIVQGMSGSPILQNGRLVGAVTHVLVNDPTRGYAILAENMLKQATGVEK